ncbi:MAG: SpoIID/LytB domain-containing protein [bacterium]
MQSYRQKILGFFLLGFIFLSGIASANQNEHMVRVGLIQGQQQVRVAAEEGFTVEELATGKTLGQSNPHAEWVFKALGEGLEAGSFLFTRPVKLTTHNKYIMVNGNPYRGQIEVHPIAGTLTVINVLPAEAYLYGVVPREMPTNFPLEALKAQAVAARTYAFANMNKHHADGFDLCATIHCQVYGGVAAEHPHTTVAVDATQNEVMRYQGHLINAYYHASSGGHTENCEFVWNSSVPYLQGVPDFDSNSPYANWVVKYSPEELDAALYRGGIQVGRIEDIELLNRGVSGRVSELRLRGSRGEQVITGNQFRDILGYTELPSTLFDIEFQNPGKGFTNITCRPEQLICVMGGDGNNISWQAGDISVVGKDQAGRQAMAIIGLTEYTQEQIVFRGSGLGHGLGLSQWGAKAMAELAPAAGPDFYRAILSHYYQGVTIEPY